LGGAALQRCEWMFFQIPGFGPEVEMFQTFTVASTTVEEQRFSAA
jgi:hypothetical protein